VDHRRPEANRTPFPKKLIDSPSPLFEQGSAPKKTAIVVVAVDADFVAGGLELSHDDWVHSILLRDEVPTGTDAVPVFDLGDLRASPQPVGRLDIMSQDKNKLVWFRVEASQYLPTFRLLFDPVHHLGVNEI